MSVNRPTIGRQNSFVDKLIDGNREIDMSHPALNVPCIETICYMTGCTPCGGLVYVKGSFGNIDAGYCLDAAEYIPAGSTICTFTGMMILREPDQMPY